MVGGGHRDWSAVVGLASVVVALACALVLLMWRGVGLPRVAAVWSWGRRGRRVRATAA